MSKTASLTMPVANFGVKSFPFPDGKDYYPPCQYGCPIRQDARGYIAAIAQGDFNQALQIILEDNPLAAVCGTICAHPCEAQCRRGKVDQPISIRVLKRAAVDLGHVPLPSKAELNYQEKIAIIGSGPAGLTAAYDLAKKGYPVTVFEKDNRAGGVLQQYIPLYRLPRQTIEKDISRILALGVQIKTGLALGKDFSLKDLQTQGYKAILLALGLPQSRGIPMPGVDAKDVLLALSFLKAVNQEGFRFPSGKRIIVVGGGNVAIDVARSAKRAGAAAVHMVCLESRKEMPAHPWEIKEAEEEGIDISCSYGPRCILTEETGGVKGLECKSVKAVFDEQGRFNPSFYEDRITSFTGDIVILAIGQMNDLSYLKDMGISLNQRGQMAYNAINLSTNIEGVFTCGEVISGPGSAVQSMASARKAVLAMHSYLRKEPFLLPVPEKSALKELDPLLVEKIKKLSRQEPEMLPANQRVTNYEFIEKPLNMEAAVQEARRCLTCGAGAQQIEDKCIHCITCFRVCPYGVPVIQSPTTVHIRAEECQACGICVGECPSRAIDFRSYRIDEIDDRLEAALKHGASKSSTVGFLCNYHPFNKPGEDSPDLHLVRTSCIAKIEARHLLKAFEMGAQGVFVAGCSEADCAYQKSYYWAQQRLQAVKNTLKEIGMGDDKLKLYQHNPSQPLSLEQIHADFIKGIAIDKSNK